MCKIGVTDDINRRIKELQYTSGSNDIELMWLVKTTKQLAYAYEKYFHEQASEWRGHGEWFYLPLHEAEFIYSTMSMMTETIRSTYIEDSCIRECYGWANIASKIEGAGLGLLGLEIIKKNTDAILAEHLKFLDTQNVKRDIKKQHVRARRLALISFLREKKLSNNICDRWLTFEKYQDGISHKQTEAEVEEAYRKHDESIRDEQYKKIIYMDVLL